MAWLLVAILVMVVALLNAEKINSKFTKPTYEELDNFQDSVFLNIDNEMEKYKKEIKKVTKEEEEFFINRLEVLSEDIDKKLEEMRYIEKRILKKIQI